jgi:hypothetical protein
LKGLIEQGIALPVKPRASLPQDAPAPDNETVAEMLRDLTEGGEGQVTGQTLVDHLGRKGFGPMLLALGVPMLAPLPPGVPIVFALPLLIVCLQMVVGRQTLWLPRWLSKRGIEREKLAKLVNKVTPAVAKVEKHLKPRLSFLVEGLGERALGVVCTVVAVVLVLPVPFANLVPSLAITAFGLALARKDGLLALAGYGLVAASVLVIWLCVHAVRLGWNHYVHHFIHHVL